MLPMRRWSHYFEQKGLYYEHPDDAWSHFSPKQRRRYVKKKTSALKRYMLADDMKRYSEYLGWDPMNNPNAF